MRYAALILKGYTRLRVSRIENFTIRPTEMVQLILGTNGSGKSSLMKELTPLPANKDDFDKDGSKEIHIVDRGHQYVAKSWFSPTTKHSLIRDGEEELNPGGTTAVQKELVKQLFNVTTDTDGLMNDSERFTMMPVSRRREWFMQLSDVNYDYAIGVYNRLREEYRNVSGSLKLDKKQLVVEQSRIITEEEQHQLIRDVRALHVELTRLIEMRAPLERPLSEINAMRLNAEQELRSLSERLLRLKVESPALAQRNEWSELTPFTMSSLADIDRHVESIRMRISAQEAVLSKSVTDHEKLKETVEILKKRGTEGIKSVQDRIERNREARDMLLKDRRFKLEGFDPIPALRSYQSVKDVLSNILHELPANEDQRFSFSKLQAERERHLSLKEQRTKKTQELGHFQGRKQHLEQHKANGSITCPKCQHSFAQGVTPEALEVLTKQIARLDDEVRGLDTAIATLDESMGIIQSYGELFREVQQTIRATPGLQPFWSHLLETNVLQTAPKRAVTMLLGLEYDLELEVKAKGHVDEIQELTKLLVQSEELGDATLADVALKLGESGILIEGITRTLSQAQQELTAFQRYRKQFIEATDLQAQIQAASVHFNDFTEQQVEALRRTCIQQCLQLTQSTLARKEEILNALNQQKAIVSNLMLTIARRTLEEEALRMSVRALSPMDGLIAEGLLGFIKTYTKQMNQLIRKIWTYRLEVMPCGVSGAQGAELDYKFPLLVDTPDNIKKDIIQGSSGMQEIIDLAFKVVAMKYLHLENGPLFLDEWGKTFDLEHRSSATAAIKGLLDTKPFSQLYMVSHYAHQYGAFTNAEVCVLDARNIAVPEVGKYNQHVTMN